MSYIFIDADEARRCAALIQSKADKLGTLTGGRTDEIGRKLTDFRKKIAALSEDLSAVTEDYAATDEKMKELHLKTQAERGERHVE